MGVGSYPCLHQRILRRLQFETIDDLALGRTDNMKETKKSMGTSREIRLNIIDLLLP